MIDTLIQDGYVIAQEYLTAAAEGDTRLFMMNGKPLRYRGKYAAFRRLRKGEDMRSNIHAGGKKAKAEINQSHLRLAEIVRPKLVQDGMFLVGLTSSATKLMEINVFSPGGLGSAAVRTGQLQRRRDRCAAAQGRLYEPLSSPLRERGDGDVVNLRRDTLIELSKPAL